MTAGSSRNSIRPCCSLPQRRRINRQIEQRDVVRHGVVEEGGNDVGRQRCQVDRLANVTVV